MSTYETHIQEEVATFISELHKEFAGQYDYIEGPDEEMSLGLEHVEAFDADVVNENPLEVSIGIPGIDLMSKHEFDLLHDDITAFADVEGVTVEQTAGNGDYVE